MVEPMATAPTSRMKSENPVSPAPSGSAPNWKSQSRELCSSAMNPSTLVAVKYCVFVIRAS